MQEAVGNNPQAVAMLEKVVESLKCTDLFSPNVRDEHKLRYDDAVASDLITALLSVSASTKYEEKKKK